jgi:hypothetical protein
MYDIDEKDRVISCPDLPQSSIGAPLPVVVASEHRAAVVYYVDQTPPDWDGADVRLVTAESDEPWAIVVFESAYAHMFGPPNDEAFNGHPLYSRGLQPYGGFVVQSSSWIRQLERMNSVHPSHQRTRFMKDRIHFILTFHDSTFECIARGFHVVRGSGPLAAACELMSRAVQQEFTLEPLVVPQMAALA